MKDLNFLKDSLIAHRGYHDKYKIPENSIPAFKRAIKKNYIIELDVRLTKDNKLVVFHDESLKRVCSVEKLVNELTYEELLKYKLYHTNYHVPLFSEILKLVEGRVPLLIEIKPYYKYGVVEKILMDELKSYKGKYAIQSFNPKTVLWFKKNYKDIPRGLLSSDFKKEKNPIKTIIFKSLFFDLFVKSDFISYNVNDMPNMFLDSKKKKKMLLGWTIKTKEKYDKLKNYCDNLICENMEEYEKNI